MDTVGLMETFNNLIVSDGFRIILLFILVILTLYAYYIEPLKHSGKISYLNLDLKTKILITNLISTTTYCVSIVGLVYTLDITKNISFIWILILCILIFGLVLHFNDTSPIIDKDNEQFKSPPKNIISIKYRLIIYYILIVLDILKFYQDYLYYGKNKAYKTTILHQYILNRFGGYGSGIDFWLGWLGIFGILIDYYNIYLQTNFLACKYDLPNTWNY
jgi:hypothetical protein